MIIITIIIISVPILWYLELMYELKSLNDAEELFGTTFFIVAIPTLMAGDFSSWEIPIMGLAAYIGFSLSAALFKFRDF